jgi:hypothetical protein
MSLGKLRAAVLAIVLAIATTVHPLQSDTLSAVARRLGATPMQVALAWLLRRAPNVLLIPGTCDFPYTFQSLRHAGPAPTGKSGCSNTWIS